jgi:uncharacterized membrane protein YobD (UPF0266 family)
VRKSKSFVWDNQSVVFWIREIYIIIVINFLSIVPFLEHWILEGKGFVLFSIVFWRLAKGLVFTDWWINYWWIKEWQ